MPGVPWIKLWVGIFDDEKIKIIERLPEGDTIVNCWLRLICMAGKCGKAGRVSIDENIPYTPDMLASVWNKESSTVTLAIQTLEKLGMIKLISDGHIQIKNWNVYQDIIPYEEKHKALNRERQRRYRESHELVTLDSRNVTAQEVEVEERNKKKNKEVKKKDKYGEVVRFTKEEYDILCYQYGTVTIKGKVEDLDNYCLSKGKRYKDDAATIRAWLKRDGVLAKPKPKVCEKGHFYTGDYCEACI
jgi:predicted phage replisome organizer